MLVKDKIYVDGAWVPSTGTGTHRRHQLHHRGGDGHDPRGHRVTTSTRPSRRQGRVPRRGRRPRSRSGRSTCTRIAEGLAARMDEIATLVSQEVGMPKMLSMLVQVGLPAEHLRLDGRSSPTTSPSRRRSATRLVVREPVGVVGCITPVELPAPPDRRQGRPRPRGRLHRRAQAVRGRSAQRLHPRRDHRRHRPARRRLQPRDRRRPGGGRGHRLAPRRRHGVVHRLDPRRQARRRARRRSAWPSVALELGGKSRQRHPRRRRPREGRHRRRRRTAS